MSEVLARWNHISRQQAAKEILPCCGSKAWADGMTARRPFLDEESLLATSDEVWRNLSESDWLEAFGSHPRIGERHAAQATAAQSSAWSAQEQRNVTTADGAVKLALVEGNRQYEERFGRIFIVSAAGRSASEILEILERRLQNDEKTEFRESTEQQRQITRIRLKKWMSG